MESFKSVVVCILCCCGVSPPRGDLFPVMIPVRFVERLAAPYCLRGLTTGDRELTAALCPRAKEPVEWTWPLDKGVNKVCLHYLPALSFTCM